MATVAVVVALFGLYLIGRAGTLEPTGPPASTMKTLLEVEPRMAITTANTPGNASYLFVISQPGSYYLTGNVIQSGSKGGILVQADSVAIDLMGFSLVGSGGTSSAITTEAPHAKNTTVRNGSVINWTGIGVRLSTGALVEDVRVQGASSFGIFVDSGVIRSCVVSNTIVKTGGSGIYADHDSLVTGCSSRDNATNGIEVVFRSLVTGSTSVSNGVNGIYLGHGADNKVVGNNVVGNTQNGIWADSGCTRNLIADNHVSGNTVGVLVDGTATANIIVRNTASENTTQNYLVVPGNDEGPVSSASTATSAWANIQTP